MKTFQKNCLSIVLLFCAGFVLQGYKLVGPVDKKYKTSSEKRRLFHDVHCKYSNVLDIKYPQLNEIEKKEPQMYRQAVQQHEQSSQKYARAVQNKHYAPMYLEWISDVIGYGVFAAHDIKQGDFIGEYSGVLRSVKDSGDNLDYAWYYTIDGLDGKKLVVDGKSQGNELRFINHAKDPNTIRIDVLGKDGIFHVCYIASQDIAKDEQLTVSYGDGYFTSRGMEALSV